MFYKLYKKVVLLPLASFVITVLIVITVYNKALHINNKLIKENVLQTGHLISKEFKNIIKTDIARLQNLKSRIEFTNGLYLDHWEKDARMLLEQNSSFKFLEWIDSTMVIKKIMPLIGNENAIGLDISKIEYRKDEWIKHTKDSLANITQWAKLTQGGYAFLVDIPVYFQNNFQGTITGGMDFKENFNKLTASLENQYSIELWDHKKVLFYDLNKNNKLKTKHNFIFEDRILVDHLDNHKWLLKISPSNDLLIYQAQIITHIALIVALILCFLISSLIYFYIRAKEGSKQTLESNFELLKTNEKLNKARNKAEKASLAKTEFLSNMSHEIRTPLHAILGFIELLKSSRLDKTDKEYLILMEKSSSNLLNIVNDILDIEKIESGKIELAEVHFNPSKTIKDLIEVNQFIFLRKNLYLKANFNNSRSMSVIGDKSKLIQIVNNIIKNGLKFTDTGGVTLTYNETIVHENQLRVTISIQDTGIGIHEDRINSIFERFTQVENSIKKQYEGSGLGLSISEIFINMMGGEISVKSTPNEGTEFIFDVLFRISEKQKIETNTVSKKNINLPDLNILIVDDNHLNIIVLKKFLEDLGIKPDTAKNGKIALEKFKEKSYHLIFMDIHMPEMDGWEATKEIRKTNKDVIIFGLSANVTTEAIDKALENGMNNYLSKPFKKEHIYKLLYFHFSNKKL
ncbi:response regulator [Thalassobellus suaedae]|uniref:histidine kinase n=1 Tax=Thalassobellus suaedae TaxID=3074124 RepID=A0ABY9XZ51_9FLAO|nr:response regulator [Flavobacteriaceae bacterium HL-DH10]